MKMFLLSILNRMANDCSSIRMKVKHNSSSIKCQNCADLKTQLATLQAQLNDSQTELASSQAELEKTSAPQKKSTLKKLLTPLMNVVSRAVSPSTPNAVPNRNI